MQTSSMRKPVQPLDLRRLRVFPLAKRRNLTRAEDILISPDAPAPSLNEFLTAQVKACAARMRAARERGATIMLIYGAHLLRNGAAKILDRMMAEGWLTHLATNGAGTIHDWEYSWFGESTESVEENVKTGTFGTWDETALNIHLALMAGALDELGYGRSLGRFISEDGANIPTSDELAKAILEDPGHLLTASRAELLRTIRQGRVAPGRLSVEHRWKEASIIAAAWKHGVPMTVHPGIGYDIISNHPIFNGAVLGRAAEWDFKLFGGSLQQGEGGVVLSVGSAIMGPQVFEKSMSCVNNLRLQEGLPPMAGHSIYVVDLQDGGNWDWNQGEPPKTNAAYYLRFCKSFSRMGAEMQYLQSDNAAFLRALWAELRG